MKFIPLCLYFLTLLTGCNKVGDTEKPKVSISYPINNDTIPVTESEVIMQFTATDNTALSSLILDITDVNGNSFFADSKEIYGTSYNYKNSFSILIHPSKTKELIMTVHILDENKNESISTSTFYLAPK